MKLRIVPFIFLSWFISGQAYAHPSTDVDEGLTMLHQGKLEEAGGAMQRARFATPTDPRVRYDLGIVEYRKREYSSAISEWRQALSMTPDPVFRSDILHNIGNASYRCGQYQASVDAYKASLEFQDNPLTRQNLEQAQKRLQEEAEQQQQGQDKKQQQSGKDGKEGKDGQQQQGGQDKKSGQDDKNQKQQQNADNKQGKDGDQKGEQQKDPQKADSKSGNASDSRQTADPNASGSEDLADKEEKERQDVAMGKDEKEKKPPPEASQRARGMVNQKLNPYDVERILKAMEEREKEVQMRYRNDPQRREDMDPFEDPFFMDAQRLRDFMEQRQGKGKKPEGDSPDW